MTLPTNPLDLIPLWLIFLLIFGLLLLGTEIGFQAGKAWRRREPEPDTVIGPMVAATLGLVGFLLAFITSMSADRFGARRALVLEEANVIGTAYLRAGYLPEPYPTESRELLLQYVDARIEGAQTGNYEAAIVRSEQVQEDLWRSAEEIVRATGGSDVYALYLESLNEMIELNTQRVIAAFYARIPASLILAAFAFTMLGMFILGFGNGEDAKRSAIALVTLVLVFGSVLYLIMDLDRSQEGFFQVSQQPLISLQERINP